MVSIDIYNYVGIAVITDGCKHILQAYYIHNGAIT